MSVVKFQTRFLKTGVILQQVDQRFKRAKNLTQALKKGAKQAQESVRQEFLGSYWKTPSGGQVSWERRKDNLNHPLLILTRALFLEWTEGQPVITPKTFSIGSSLPYAEVQRGGTGSDIQQSPLWKNITPRPHGTRNPELDEKIRETILEFIVFGTT